MPETSLATACPGLLLLGLPWLSLQGWLGVALGSLPGHSVPLCLLLTVTRPCSEAAACPSVFPPVGWESECVRRGTAQPAKCSEEVW
jgi:hypothetical protein